MRYTFSFSGTSEHRLLHFDDPEALKKPLLQNEADKNAEPKKEDEVEKKEEGLEKDLRDLIEGGTKERVEKADADAKKSKENLGDTEKKKAVLKQGSDVSPGVSMSVKTVDDKATKEAQRINENADSAAKIGKDMMTLGVGPDAEKTATQARIKTKEISPVITTNATATEQTQSAKNENTRQDSVKQETAEGQQKKAA